MLLNLLHKEMDPSVIQDEIDLFIKWWDTNHLILHVNMKPCHHGEESLCRYVNPTTFNYNLSQPPFS